MKQIVHLVMRCALRRRDIAQTTSQVTGSVSDKTGAVPPRSSPHDQARGRLLHLPKTASYSALPGAHKQHHGLKPGFSGVCEACG
jgi:hypothetical protein